MRKLAELYCALWRKLAETGGTTLRALADIGGTGGTTMRTLAETGGNWRKLAELQYAKLAETGGNWRKLAETGGCRRGRTRYVLPRGSVLLIFKNRRFGS